MAYVKKMAAKVMKPLIIMVKSEEDSMEIENRKLRKKNMMSMVGIFVIGFLPMGGTTKVVAESNVSGMSQLVQEGFGHQDGKVQSPLGFRSDPRPPTDGQIEGAIERRLEMDSRITADRVGVTVKDHAAILYGTVDTIKEKKMATVVAGSVRGVSAVVNDLRVRTSLSRDEKIKRDVKQVIHPVNFKKENRLLVTVENGVVTLEGEVLDRHDLRQAGSAVEDVPGVIKIVNLVRVINETRSDTAIEKDVIAYLMTSPLVNDEQLDVNVNNGVVSLEGTIDHLTYRDVLQIDIENIQGVKHVRVGKLIPERLTATARNQ
jgi:osmotically-inducible protein OsmY